jgi:hypothetical protein
VMSWFKKVISRIDFYAAHCYGRVKSCIPLSLFYAADGLLNGLVKRALSAVGAGMVPAGITFLYYFYFFLSKANETYDVHPEVTDPKLEDDKFRDTTKAILSLFNEYSEDSRAYLDKLGIDESINLNAYETLLELYSKIQPHHPNTFNSFLSSLLHGVTHLNEYLLLKYFADINLLQFNEEFSLENLVGLSILIAAVFNSCQSFYFHQQSHNPTTTKLWESVTQDFRLFRKGRMLNQREAILENGCVDEKLRLLIEGENRAKCYLSCH